MNWWSEAARSSAIPPAPGGVRASRFLAGILAFGAIIMAAFGVARDFEVGHLTSDTGYAVAALLLAGMTIAVVPRFGAPGLHAALTASWLIVAGLTTTMPTPAGQVLCGMGLLTLALFAAFFMPRQAMLAHLGGMSLAYLLAVLVSVTTIGPLYPITVLIIVFGAALSVDTMVESERLNREQYRMLAENSSDVVFRLDADAIVQWCSPSVHDVLGWQPSDVVGRHITDLVLPADLPLALPERTDGPSGVTSTVARFLLAGGGSRHMSVAGRRWTGPVDGVVQQGIVVGLRDVEALVQMRDEAAVSWNLAELARRDVERERELLVATVNASLDPNVLLQPVRDSSDRVVDFTCAYANDAACEFFHATRQEFIGSSLRSVLERGQDHRLLHRCIAALDTAQPLQLDDYAWSGGHQHVPERFDIRAVPIADALSMTWRNVSQRYAAARALAESERRYRLLAENSSDVVMTVRNGVMLWVSPSLTDMLGWRPDEWVGQPMRAFTFPDDVGQLVERELSPMPIPKVRRWRVQAKDGSYHWIEANSKDAIEADGGEEGHVVSFRTVDAAVAAEEELNRRARYDSLTGLVNRKEALDQLGVHSRISPRTGTATAVLFCDLDRFKGINDGFGHAAGDAVLRTVAQRMRACIRSGDVAARVGGDELLVVLRGVRDGEDARVVADKIRRHVREPILIEDARLEVTMSIGVALAVPDEPTADLIARADAAMYEAKRGGRDQVVMIDAPDGTGAGEVLLSRP